jgi:CHAT domain-containing protein
LCVQVTLCCDPATHVTAVFGEVTCTRAEIVKSTSLMSSADARRCPREPTVGADTPAGNGRSGDGLLTAREIYGLDLNADLVVLSACRSAGGHVTADGIATFARAFMYAGTPSLVASVWDVADQPANRLLPDFYREWLGGATKARALRTAQLRLLRAKKLQIDTPLGKIVLPQHPVFWAGFVLFGEPE